MKNIFSKKGDNGFFYWCAGMIIALLKLLYYLQFYSDEITLPNDVPCHNWLLSCILHFSLPLQEGLTFHGLVLVTKGGNQLLLQRSKLYENRR